MSYSVEDKVTVEYDVTVYCDYCGETLRIENTEAQDGEISIKVATHECDRAYFTHPWSW